MKLNFKKFPMYQGIDKSNIIITDISHAVADGIYNTIQGLAAHALALKIYNSTDEEDYNDEEINILTHFSYSCTPAFIDSLKQILSEQNSEQ